MRDGMITEADTCREFVTPKLVEAGWGAAESVIGEQHSFTNGRIIVAGGKVRRGKQRRADYLLYYRRDYPLAGIYGLAHLADAEAPAVVSPLPPSEALGLLLCAASGVNGDPERREELLDALGRLLSVVRRGRVAFSVRGRVWDVLEGAEP